LDFKQGNIAHNTQAFWFLNDEKFQIECPSHVGWKKLRWIKKKYGSVEKFNDNEEAVHNALHIIKEKFEFVAILEESLSVKAFESIFHTKLEKSSILKELKEHSSNKKSVSMMHRELIRNRNKLDMKIYNNVVDLLKSQVT